VFHVNLDNRKSVTQIDDLSISKIPPPEPPKPDHAAEEKVCEEFLGLTALADDSDY
jgi:hypothetical protein